MKATFPWLRSLASFPLGLLTIDWFHRVCDRVVPGAYVAGNDVAFLLLVLAAGIAGCVVAFAVTGHRSWVHAGLFLVVMGVVDGAAVMGELATRPLWFRAMVMGTLPLQVWIGMVLVKRVFRYTSWS